MTAPTDLKVPPRAPDGARRRTRLIVAVLLAVAVAWLGFRAVLAFDQERHAAEAAAVLAAPDTVTHRLPPAPGRQASPPPGEASPRPRYPGAAEASPQPRDPGAAEASPQPRDAGAPEREGNPQPGGVLGGVHSPSATGAGGRFSYRPGTWLSVVDLQGLDPVAGDERYLVFLRNWAGWTLAGAASPGPDGGAQVRSAAEPRPPTIYEVVVTRAVDDATSIPHGQPLLQWFDASLGPPKARPFDFARGA
jgi:hypothetical protein